MNIVITMAGQGSRTKDFSETYKPFIVINGRSILELSLLGLPLKDNHLIFVVRDEYASELRKVLSEIEWLPKVDTDIITVQETTSGQAESALIGMRDIPKGESVLISNCDTFFTGTFPDFSDADGYIATFTSTSELYSYVRVQEGLIVETAEKVVISDRASAGIYYFSSRQLYEDIYYSYSHSGEKYIAPMYNQLILKGNQVREFKLDNVVPLGTASELLAAAGDPSFTKLVEEQLSIKRV